MKKLANHIILSGVTVSMLFSPLMALPSGGKFTHGTTGTINKPNNNTLNIHGNGTNSVIQWGGGFSINQGESVNFNGNNKNYLNIAHGTSKSTIDGLLNANGNNVFLINPNGVIITKNGTINANRFVASTSSMSNEDMNKFAKLSFNDGLSFSPVFKPQKAGNVVNMGNINADSLLFQGNKILLDADTNWDKEHNGVKFGIIKARNITLEGDEVHVNVASIDGSVENPEFYLEKIKVIGKGQAYLDATGYYYNTSSGRSLSLLRIDNSNNKSFKVHNYIGISSVRDWWHFAKGWNENKKGFRTSASEYRLTNDIDFGGNSDKNYANYWIDLNGDGQKQDNEYTSMIIGYGDENYFNKKFDGQGFTLSSMYIDTTALENKPQYVGIFGKIYGDFSVHNLNVDYNQGYIKTNNAQYVGGLVGAAIRKEHSNSFSEFKNINIKNISFIDAKSNSGLYVGGFAGILNNARVDNIELYGIKTIVATGVGGVNLVRAGGFVGRLEYVNRDNPIEIAYDTIKIKDIDSIKSTFDCDRYCGEAYAGGFAGDILVNDSYFKMKNITLEDIGNIEANTKGYLSTAGGFFGNGEFNIFNFDDQYNMDNVLIENITMKNIGNIKSIASNQAYSGGFFGDYLNSYNFKTSFENIFIYFKPDSSIVANGSVAVKDIFGNKINSKNQNIFIYHKNLDGANNNGVTERKYTNDELMSEFNEKIQSIKTPNIEKPSEIFKPDLSDIGNIQNEKVEFQKEWYNKEVVQAILDDILNGKYRVSINKFGEIVFYVSTVDGVEITLDSIKQSLDFLDTLKDKNSGFESSEKLKDIYAKYNKALKIKDEYVAAQEHLFKDGKNSFYETYAKYQKELEIYNSYVKEIEAGKRKINDPEYLASFDKINSLATILKNQRDVVNNIATKLNDENIAKNEYGYTNFKFLGDFALDFVHNPQSPDVDNPNKPELPETDMNFEQTASLNLIGDEALEEEDEKQEVEEASMKQRSRTCIVSDNFKTMNPCVVGGM
ncbi:filamentous hemagglutinin N-terminal domain-containing protein [Campylobacter armoricus]|uniref:two-partner secretion domain-containing protein n=2 Tax=Campylobacter armoricus TaxID=2505970 RepID=UPI00125FD13B|nr:filamentous hemagglutinin N-terminal domain-containing protein [Campylobacter armoricus]